MSIASGALGAAEKRMYFDVDNMNPPRPVRERTDRDAISARPDRLLRNRDVATRRWHSNQGTSERRNRPNPSQSAMTVHTFPTPIVDALVEGQYNETRLPRAAQLHR